MNATTQNKLAEALRLARAELEKWLDNPAADGETGAALDAACKALAEHDAAPRAHDVLFSREVHDEVFDGRTTTEAERFDQLAREIHEADPELPLTFRACVTHDGNSETFLARTTHNGDTRSLRDRLQASYDSHGVAGFFQIGADA